MDNSGAKILINKADEEILEEIIIENDTKYKVRKN